MLEGDGATLKELFLLALKGRIVVHFLDGTTLEGDYATQDELNIFVVVGEGPVLIPRSQVKFIQGNQGQSVERDTSQAAFRGVSPTPAEPAAPELVPPPIEAAPPEAAPPPAETALPDPVVLERITEAGQINIKDFIGVEAIPQLSAVDEEEEEEDGTLILAPEKEAPPPVKAEVEAMPESPDKTFIFGDFAPSEKPETAPVELPADEAADEDDATYIFGAKKEEKRAPAAAQLICTAGPHTGDVFTLTGGLSTLGRSVDSNLPLNKDKEISRRHAIIVQEGDRFFIQDQNSLNGTFVNSELIKGSHYLQEGDIILVGLSTLEFHAG